MAFLRFAEAELTTQGVRHPKVTATGLAIGHTEPLPEGFKGARKKSPGFFALPFATAENASNGGKAAKRRHHRVKGTLAAAAKAAISTSKRVKR